MQKLVLFFLIVSAFCLPEVSGAHEVHHVKHNMVLYGNSEIFASHIVYKVPHNYQVIVKFTFEDDVKYLYLNEKAAFPKDQFIFLLDEMNISDIANQTFVSGTLLRTNSTGQRIELRSRVLVPRRNFEIVYFKELPTDLK